MGKIKRQVYMAELKKKILRLRDEEGLSFSVISERIGKHPDAVYNLYQRQKARVAEKHG